MAIAVEKHVVVHHAGLYYCKPIEPWRRSRLMFTEDEGLNFVGGEISPIVLQTSSARPHTEEVEAKR